MAFKFKTLTGQVIWVGTNVFRVSGLKSGVVRRFRKIQEDKKVTFDDLEKVLEKILAEQGLEDTKKWLRDNKFSGDAINLNPARMFNCSYLPVVDPLAFSETMILLLSGA